MLLMLLLLLISPAVAISAGWVYPQFKPVSEVAASAYLWILVLIVVFFFTQNQWFSWLMLLPDPWVRMAMLFYGWFGYLILAVVIGTVIGWGFVKVLPDQMPIILKALIASGSAIGFGLLTFPLWRLDSGSSTVYAQQAARQQNRQEVLDIQLAVMSRFGMEREAAALQRRGAQPGWWPESGVIPSNELIDPAPSDLTPVD